MKHLEIIRLFKDLPQNLKDEVMNQLLKLFEEQELSIEDATYKIDQNWISPPSCPHCGFQKCYRRGYYKKIPRFSCKKCNKYWMATHGTALQGLKKKHLWTKYIQAFLEKHSLRKAALIANISLGTSFNWRHLILANLSQIIPKKLEGTIECKKLAFPYLEKGKNNTPNFIDCSNQLRPISKPNSVNIVVGRSRMDGVVISGILAMDNPSPSHYKQELEKMTLYENFLVVDSKFNNLIKKTDRIVYKYKKNKPIRKRLHINNVEQESNKIRNFLNSFRGVSTKYLYNYLGWYSYSTNQSDQMKKARCLLDESLVPRSVKQRFLSNKIFGINIITLLKLTQSQTPPD